MHPLVAPRRCSCWACCWCACRWRWQSWYWSALRQCIVSVKETRRLKRRWSALVTSIQSSKF